MVELVEQRWGRSASMKNGDFMKLISCRTPEEVYERVRGWSSDLSQDEHLVRSTILDIQASLEGQLKYVLNQVLMTVLFQGSDRTKNSGAEDDLYGTVAQMSFSSVFRILRPVLRAFPSKDFDAIQAINDLRNRVAHSKSLSDVKYKGRNPFTDADCFAQVFLDAWAARQGLKDFYQRMIEEPASMAALHARFYRERSEANADH
jgi:hypothetical protein